MAAPPTGATGNPVGRPSSYPTLAQPIIDAMRLGLSRSQAAEACGVTHATVERWCEQFEEFDLAVKGAREAGILARLKRIDVAGQVPERWQANAWMLERSYPDRFALVNRVQLDARVVVENLRTIAGQLGIAVDPVLEAEVVEEVRLIAAEDAATTRRR